MTRRRAAPVAAPLAGMLTALAAGTPAAAHAFGQRYDLPLPLGFYLGGAGLAVALSFAGSFAFMAPARRAPRAVRLRLAPAVARTVRVVGTGVAVTLLGLVTATAVAGPEAATANLATVLVWVFWWVGLVLAAALVVDLWTPFNPFAALARGVLGPAGRRRALLRLPPGAAWLSVPGLLAIAWLELVSDWSEDPRAMAVLIGLYGAGLVGGAAVFGRRRWFALADPVTRLFLLMGRVAPLALGRRTLCLRLPGAGLVGRPIDAAGAVFVVTLIGIVLFDGLSETPFWAGLLEWITQSQSLRPRLIALREAGVDLMKLIRTLGLLATVALANLLYLGLAAAVWRAGRRGYGFARAYAGFAPSLLPIAVAYHLAHYVSYLALAGQLLLPIASDPFGLGWDLLGWAGRPLDIGVITAGDVWWIAVAALVAGHGCAVLVAHAEALRLYPSPARAILSQLPMMVFMVALTSFSLWILSQPIVE
ncbi:MAG TPA: hypothetical protein VMM55_08370 [Thermohalobaculum sp.]|nr:hypothetical protein [Thermohalobaculum sp.]